MIDQRNSASQDKRGISAHPIGVRRLCTTLAEFFPSKPRFTALSIGYSLTVTIFGGFAPGVATDLIRETGSSVSPILIKDRMNARLA